MKILHIIDSLGLGGAQTIVKGIFEYQPENKDIFLYALRKREITTKIKHTNVKICNSTKKYSLKSLFELRDLIKKEKIDILHCHLFRSQVFGWVLKIIWFKNIKLIFHEHGGIIEDGLLYSLFLRLSQNSVNIFIAVSRAMENALIKNTKNNEQKIKIIYNFVDLEKFNKKNITWNIQKERNKLGIRNEFVVGFAGRIVERKGWREFIKAAEFLVKKYSNMKFIIAGDGVQRDKMLLFIEKWGLKDKIIYIGYKSNMTWFYSLLDCFVIPSHWEPMGITEIEAQAMNIPVIASNVEGLSEVIEHGENGILFKAKDHIDLAEKIILIKNNRQLKENLLKNSMESVKEYSIDRYVKKLKTIYEF